MKMKTDSEDLPETSNHTVLCGHAEWQLWNAIRE